jgi:hypothetical protein
MNRSAQHGEAGQARVVTTTRSSSSSEEQTKVPRSKLRAAEVAGQAVVHPDLHATMARHSAAAYATLAWPGFLPVTDHPTIQVS